MYVRETDGDTVHVQIDQGLDTYHNHSLRFAGINTPELGTEEGKAAAAYVAGLIPPGTVLTIRTAKDKTEKYGRYLAWLYLGNSVWLNRLLIIHGFAVPYGPLPIDPPPA